MKTQKNVMFKLFIIIAIYLVGCPKVYSGSRIATINIPFKNSASGGRLILADTLNRNARFVYIDTFSGEPAETVVDRLARAIADSNSLFEYDRVINIDRDSAKKSMARGSTLRLTGTLGDYCLSGTEKGLCIPYPPVSLSCSYNEPNDSFILYWINPPGGYDSIMVILNWRDFDWRNKYIIPGMLTSYTIDRKKVPVDIGDLDIWLIGFRDNIPSNATAIHISGHCLEEIYGIPFSDGIAPNWTAWSTSAQSDRAAFEQGEKYTNLLFYNPVKVLLTKPFYQVINAPSLGGVHGVYRKFLGLMPGHTYRLAACISTLEMDSINGDWSLSLCATHNGPDGMDLTIQQLAGLTPLPDGSRAPEAGRIGFYNQDNTTKGEYEIMLSGYNSHIRLPAGVDTITVWIRFTCSDPKGKIGFSGVKLDDISADDNAKSSQRVIQDEFSEEASFLEKKERFLHSKARRALRSEIADVRRLGLFCSTSIDSSPTLGPENAPVTIVMFSNMRDPDCADEYGKVLMLTDEFPNQIRLVYKHAPYISRHKGSLAAHVAAILAYEQRGSSGFWEMHDLLLENFNLTRTSAIRRLMEQEKLDTQKYERLSKNKVETNKLVHKDYSEAKRCQVTETPSIFINNKKLVDRSIEGYRKRIKEILNNEPSNNKWERIREILLHNKPSKTK